MMNELRSWRPQRVLDPGVLFGPRGLMARLTMTPPPAVHRGPQRESWVPSTSQGGLTMTGTARLSYSHGASPDPLLGETIGDNLRRIAAAHPDREVLVDVPSGRRWT